MSRSYSEKFLLELYKSNANNPGIALALSCVEANLPATCVAEAFGVTRMSIHSWFRGKPLRYKHQKQVEDFLDIVTKDLKDGILLPVKTQLEARAYLAAMNK